MKRRDFIKGVFATVVGVPLLKLAPYLPEPVAKFNWKTYPASVVTTQTISYDKILSQTLQRYRKQVYDNIFTSYPWEMPIKIK